MGWFSCRDGLCGAGDEGPSMPFMESMEIMEPWIVLTFRQVFVVCLGRGLRVLLRPPKDWARLPTREKYQGIEASRNLGKGVFC